MQVLTTPSEMNAWSSDRRRQDHSIGFVPTMGALHQGHETLIRESVSSNHATVLSIFVNPAQFNVTDDFLKYPRTMEADLSIARNNKVDAIYAPTVDVMYPKGFSVVVQPGNASEGMEGSMRPGHFQGVTTVVTKLFHAVDPHRAYFGKKDYQQLAVIRQMVLDLDFAIDVVGVETVRDPDGLALSSRNIRLSAQHRHEAVVISQGLFTARQKHQSGTHNATELRDTVVGVLGQSDSARIEYVEVCNANNLQPIDNTRNGAVICVAAWFGDVRLIDNIELSPA